MSIIDEKLDHIFDYLDDLFLDGKFEEANNHLRSVDIANTPIVLLIGYLTITFCAKDKLPYRGTMFLKTKWKIEDECP